MFANTLPPAYFREKYAGGGLPPSKNKTLFFREKIKSSYRTVNFGAHVAREIPREREREREREIWSERERDGGWSVVVDETTKTKLA